MAVWAVGLGGGGDYKEYLFGPPVHDLNVVPELDSVDRSSPGIETFHRKIARDWWLEFQHWP